MTKSSLPVSSKPEGRAIGYTRVSTQEQQRTGSSHEVQKELITKYASKNQYDLDCNDIYPETHSASKIKSGISSEVLTGRPILQHVINMAKDKEFKYLICYSHDRLSRSFPEFLALKALLKKQDVELVFVKPGENMDSNNSILDKFFELMLSNMAQLEAQVIGLRVKGTGVTNTRLGYSVGGKTAFGYKLKNPLMTKRNEYVKSEKSPIIEEIFFLYLNGYNCENIAEKIKSKYHGENSRMWTKGTIASILRNRNYTGTFVWNKKCRCITGLTDDLVVCEKKNLAIVGKDIFESVSEIKSRQKGSSAKYFSTPFLLRDKLICGMCGSCLKPKNFGKDKTNIYYCKCDSTLQYWTLRIPQPFIENFVLETIEDSMKALLSTSNLDGYYDTYSNLYDNEKHSLEIDKKNIDEKLSSYSQIRAKCSETLGMKNYLQMSDESRTIYTNSFFEVLQNLDTELKAKETDLYKLKQEILKREKLSKLSKEDFILTLSETLSNLIKSYKISKTQDESSIKNRSRRIFIDKILDKVIVNSTPQGETLTIYLKLPQLLENYNIRLSDSAPINTMPGA
jgi:site-specific DNA recombinase